MVWATAALALPEGIERCAVCGHCPAGWHVLCIAHGGPGCNTHLACAFVSGLCFLQVKQLLQLNAF